MNYKNWLENRYNIFKEIFHKIDDKIPQNIPKFIIPIVCGIPILYYFHKKWYSRVTIEDNYQNIINEKNNTIQSTIDSIIFFNMDSINTINYEIMCNKLMKFNENYNKSSSNKITDIFLFNNKQNFINCKNYHYKIWLDMKNQRFYGKLNRELIGGSNIWKFYYTAFINEQSDNFYFSRFYHILFAIKLILQRNKIPRIKNPITLFENKMNIQRYIIKETLRKNNNIKAIIIYYVMQRLYYCLKIKNLERDLVCILPIAFYNTTNINNNFGIMWLTFNELDTVESIKKKMDKNEYQIFGTNFLLSNGLLDKNSCSKNIRKNADAVIAILSTEDPNNIEISWTYSNIADYPVYVAIHSRLSENTVYLTQTYTVNTPYFEPGELQKSEDNYLFDNL